MISLSKLSQITNLREREIKLPDDNPFTQITSFQIQLAELEDQHKKNQSNQELSQYANISYNESIDNDHFIDNQTIDDGNRNYVQVSELEETDSFQTNQTEGILIYGDNEVIGIPEVIKLSFTSANDSENIESWYIYGVKNPDSFFKSCILHN